MSNLKSIISQYKQENNPEWVKVKIKGNIYFYDEAKNQYISIDNPNIIVKGERIQQANIEVEII